MPCNARRRLRVVAFALAGCVFAPNLSARAAAAVLPPRQIAAALASAKNLHRHSVPTALNVPYYQLDGSGAEGFIDRDMLDYGYLANGADVLIVPLESGGSGGIFSTLLFTAVRSKPGFVGPLSSPNGHLDVHLERGRIVVRTPVYAQSDPNCCPTAHRIVRYTLDRGRLKKLDEAQTR